MTTALRIGPVLARELRVSSRRAGTYWLRFGITTALTAVVGMILLVSELMTRFGGGAGTMGSGLFAFLQAMALMATASGGLFLATDTLSEERRDGTLGLLLLTPLRALDVVLGKQLVAMLRAGQWLLGAFPLAGISVWFGSVLPEQVVALGLASFNLLFWSVAVALAVSAWCREWTRAFALTLLVYGFCYLAPLLMGWLAASWVGWLSPWTCIAASGVPWGWDFGGSMALTHGEAWLALVLAGWKVRRMAEDSGHGLVPVGVAARPVERVNRPGGMRDWLGLARQERRWLVGHPIRWLASRDSWLARWLSGLALALLVVVTWLVVSEVDELWIQGLLNLSGVVSLLMVLYLASQSSRFFADAARSGFLELLMVSPLGNREMVRGQLWALGRSLLIPLVVVMSLQGLQWWLVRAMTAASVAAMPAAPGMPGNMGAVLQAQMFLVLLGTLTVPVQMAAIAWFGILMGLMCQRPMKAFILTLALGWLAPSIVSGMVHAMTLPLLFLGNMLPEWAVIVGVGAVGFGIQLGLLLGARRYLYANFRRLAAGGS